MRAKRRLKDQGNALAFSSRVVGEKTEVTSWSKGVQLGGGRHLAAAHAETEALSVRASLQVATAACLRRTRCQCFTTSQDGHLAFPLGNPSCCLVKQMPRLITPVLAQMLSTWARREPFGNQAWQVRVRPCPASHYVYTVDFTLEGNSGNSVESSVLHRLLDGL